MSDNSEKPSLWQRVKNGTKNFFSHALGYIPRGILLTSVVFGVSAAMESATGYGLGVQEWATNGSLLYKFGAHLAIGSLASGIIGVATTPCPACTQAEGVSPQPSGSPILRQSEVALGQKITQGLTEHGTNALLEGSGLPPQLVSTAAKALNPGR